MVADPGAHTLYDCDVRRQVCQELTLSDSASMIRSPASTRSKNSPDGGDDLLHEDLGATIFARLPVKEYRDRITLGTGASRFEYVRHFFYSAELGIDLSLTIDHITSPTRHMTFTATEISRTEPDAGFFQIPHGYAVVDHRLGK